MSESMLHVVCYRLRMVKGAGEERLIALNVGENVIGRGRDATIRLPYSAVSRRHCQIDVPEDATRPMVVQDVGSRNGTILNGQELKQPCELKVGDILTIAGLQLIVEEGA